MPSGDILSREKSSSPDDKDNSYKISVITPTYQLLDLIYWNVDYSRRRFPPDFPIETIIVDGGSDTYIRERLKNLETDTIKVITVEDNKHDSFNVNAACEIAKGKYIIKLDSDVLVLNKGFWNGIVEILDKEPNALIGHTLTHLWTRGNGDIFSGCMMAWRKDIGLKWDETYLGYGPSDMDWNLQFLEKGYPLIQMKDRYSIVHLGGIVGGMYYVKSRERMKMENKYNHDCYFKKWEKKLPELKGYL